jgi:hypothetical protein
MSSKKKTAIAALLLAVGGALAASFAPQLSPTCAAIDPELVEDALGSESSGSGSDSGESSSSG